VKHALQLYGTKPGMKKEKEYAMKKIAVFFGFGIILCFAAGCALPVGEDYIMPRNQELGSPFIADYNLQNYVPAPVVGARPVFQVATRGDLAIQVTWTKAADVTVDEDELFAADTIYKAEITITLQNSYNFYSDQSFSYYPADPVETLNETGSTTRTVTVTFKSLTDSGTAAESGINVKINV
jgi:hypothetical protein